MKKAYKHQKNYEVRQKEKGLVKVTLWTPTNLVKKLKDFAKSLRESL